MNVPIYQNEEHSLSWMTILILHLVAIKSSGKNFLPHGFHIYAVLLLDNEGFARIEPHLRIYIHNIHIP